MEEIKVNQTDEIVYKEVLSNGLTVYLYPSDKVKTFDISLMTKFGAMHTKFKYKDEDKIYTVPNGIAHFLEHITFHLDGMEANDLFKSFGAYINAFTTYERTSYIVNGTIEFDKCLDNLLYYVYTNYYTEETVENEKNIIKEEAKMGMDNMDRRLEEEKAKALFIEANYKEKVVGELEDIDSITLEDIKIVYNTFYQPSNMVLTIAGNFNVDNALEIINKRMSEFTFTNREFEIIKPVEPTKVKEEYHEETCNGLNDKVSYSIKIPLEEINKLGMSRPEFFNYFVYVMSSNFGRTSLYYEELLDKNIVNDRPYQITYLLDDFIIAGITATVMDGKMEDFLTITKKYSDNITIDEKEINRKIKCDINNFITMFDYPGTIQASIEYDIVDYGRYVNEYLDVIKGFTVEKAKKILECIDFNNKSIVIMRKKEDN